MLRFIATALAGFAVCNLHAQTNSLTLADARRIAFERNWDLLAAKSGVDLAAAQLLVVKEFPNPGLSLATFKIGDREASTPAGTNLWARSYDTIVAVNQLIEIAGKRRDRQAGARAGVLGARARFLDAKRTLDQGVTKAYIAALLAQTNAQILTESADYMRHEQEIAEARFKAGDLAKSDFEQIEVANEQYELQAKSADLAAIQARIAVEVLLGINQPEGHWVSADSLETISVPVSAESSIADAARPDLLAAESDLRAARENLKLQKAIRVPDPAFSVGYEHLPPSGGPPEDTMNVGVSFPLPIWNLNRGAIHAAEASVEQSRLALVKLQAQAVSDAANAEAASHEATERLQRYRAQIGPQSASARQSVMFKFEKGGATLVDLLEAERTDNDVRLATAQAMADTASAAADLVAARAAVSRAELNSSQRTSAQ